MFRTHTLTGGTSRRRLIAGTATLVTAAAVAFMAGSARAEASWPTQPVKLVVGFPAGSSPDLTARTIAEPLSAALGQPVVVENKPGAGGNIAAAAVAKATDGHTLGLMINGNLTIAKVLVPSTAYDPHKDLAPVSLIAVAPLVLTVPASTAGSSEDILAAARKAGDQWNYGSPGVGTVAHLGMELFKVKSGIAPMHVPYKGNPDVIAAMLGGQVQMAMLPPGLAMAQVQGGKLKAVGVTSAGRSPVVPSVPSLAELGVKGMELEIWNAVAAPKSMPSAQVGRLSALISDIVRQSAVRDRIAQQGWKVVGGSSEALAARMKADTAVMTEVIRTAKVQQ